MQKWNYILFLSLFLVGCTSNMKMQTIDLEGHRGCRGLYPENTITGFLKAIDIGVSTLELDVVISKDKQVVVSHDPFFNHEISLDPDKNTIHEDDEPLHNIYQMDYDEIISYDVGSKPSEGYPNQEKQKESKPLLRNVFHTTEQYCKDNNLPSVAYNIEIKRKIKWDYKYHPNADEFVSLVMQEVMQSGISNRIIIQCFDMECLQIIHQEYPNIKLSLLVSNSESPKRNIEELGFLPDVYSPSYRLVDKSLVIYCQQNKMKLIPWTVNSKKDILNIIEMNVDGFITDYPDIAVSTLNENHIKIQSCFNN